MGLPKLSIITVCYNSEATIETTIQSVIAQKYPSKEFIVIDGKSTDRTREILERYRDSISVLISEEDKGIPDALNKGIIRATGQWLYFLSSDDVFYNDEVLADVFSGDHTADMLYGNVILKTSGLKYDGEFDLRKLLMHNICHQAQFYRRELFEKVGNYNVDYRTLSDYDHSLRIFADQRMKIAYVDKTIAIFNDTGRTSYTFDRAFWRDRRKIFIDRFRNLLPRKELYTSYEPYLYYYFKTGKIFKGVGVLVSLLYYTRNRKYINAALKNLFHRM